jgi:hypothetical protein
VTHANPHISPSGPLLPVILDSDDVLNVSTVPEETLTQALDHLYERRIQYLDLDDDPVALWQFNDTTNAVRGPNLNLAASTGQWGFADGYPGVRSLIANIGARLQFNPDPNLILLGAMSVEMIFALNSLPFAWLCGVGGTDGTGLAADNVAWGMGFVNNVTPRNATYFWERNANAAVSFTTPTTAGTTGFPTVHVIISAGFSRSASGIVTPYLNGTAFGSPSGALALPNGGSNGVFSIGAQAGTTANDNFTFFSAAVYDRERPASEWLASYNRSVGEGLGFLA